MDTAPTDTSGIFKQAVTPLKPCGRVEGFTGATAFVDGGGFGWSRYFRKMDGRLHRICPEIQVGLPLGLKVWVG